MSEAVDTLIAVVVLGVWGFTLFVTYGFGRLHGTMWSINHPDQLEEIKIEALRRKAQREWNRDKERERRWNEDGPQ